MPPDHARHADPAGQFSFLSGFEGTQMFGHDTDVLDTSEHARRYPEDLGLLAADGLKEFRCCIPWHKIERVRGIYDWTWTDSYLRQIRQLRLRPIVDPLHHTSFPHWLTHGFADPQFPRRYTAFLAAFSRRYPWVTHFTVVNEPVATAILSGFIGAWYPHWRGRDGVAPMILGVVRAIHQATAMLEASVPGLRIVHVDTCEKHCALDAASRDHAAFSNHLRFAVLDLLLGRMDAAHPLYALFRRHGLTAAELALYRDQPARIDVLGLDYYAHSEMGWTRAGSSDAFRPLGFRGLAMEYIARYPFDVMLSETNMRGRIEDRMTWLKYMVRECEALMPDLQARGLRFDGFCWYPFIDSTDWDSLCRTPDRNIDPQGIYYLSHRFDRMPSELSQIYAQLAAGKIGSAQIPAYQMETPVLVQRRAGKFLCHMADFDWQDGSPSPAAALCPRVLALSGD